MSLPNLDTPRLRLRPFRRADVDDLHRLWIDPEVRRYLWDDQAIARERAAEVVAGCLDSADRHGLGMWRLLPRARQEGGPARLAAAGDRLLGFCGLRHVAGSAEVELLYGLYPKWWGQGLATEAARAVLDDAFGRLGVSRVLAGMDSPNVRSQRVVSRLGMTRLPDPLPAVPSAIYYELRRPGVGAG